VVQITLNLHCAINLCGMVVKEECMLWCSHDQYMIFLTFRFNFCYTTVFETIYYSCNHDILPSLLDPLNCSKNINTFAISDAVIFILFCIKDADTEHFKILYNSSIQRLKSWFGIFRYEHYLDIRELTQSWDETLLVKEGCFNIHSLACDWQLLVYNS